MRLSEEVLHSFHLSGDIVPLSGGQNTSVRVGDAVLKPVDDVRHTEWLLHILHKINPQGYRLSKPVRSVDGSFVCQGWACAHYEQGQDAHGRIEEKLRVSRLFHRDLAAVDHRAFPQTDNPWAKGHRIAWQLEELPTEFPKEVREIINRLLARVSLKEPYKVQIVHSDLSGNILFDPGLEPLIIDFSPAIAPVEYAEAILVCDCIAWQGSAVSEVNLLPDDELYKEMIMRAVIFRLAVSAILSQGDYDRFMAEYKAFQPIADYID
ncbi:fructosamine kinase family protein [Paenibacillus glycanilyticus]|uniref:fructosamine kinase family protein n=1 Tax=Paenibacillus glycanilyticus TaxID=126569 RepID=UPI002040130D|nr:fructosamine kinase family protein [Paenibacillus glycanilyticus]MCM3626124.1 fructosamine kinase family protein [Paenibacillus glycanilyticus]